MSTGDRRRRHEHESASTPFALTRRIAPNALPIAILLIVIVFAIAEPAFIKPDNLIGIVRQVALVGIMAVCMTFVIMTGGIDLSVGPVLALAGLVAYFAWRRRCRFPSSSSRAWRPAWSIGAVNGVLVAYVQLAADHRHAGHAQHRARVAH